MAATSLKQREAWQREPGVTDHEPFDELLLAVAADLCWQATLRQFLTTPDVTWTVLVDQAADLLEERARQLQRVLVDERRIEA